MSYVVEAVQWDAVEAAALREAMTREIRVIYPERIRPPKGAEVEADTVVSTVVVRANGVAVGHAALRRIGEQLEIKRFYVMPAHRGKGVSRTLLDALEVQARRLGADRLVLRTGDRQPQAMRMYERFGYPPTDRFPPYQQTPSSRFSA